MPLQRKPYVLPEAFGGGRYPSENSSSQSDCGEIAEDMPIECERIVRHCRNKLLKSLGYLQGKIEAECPGYCRQQQVLGKKLPEHPPACRAQRDAHGDSFRRATARESSNRIQKELART